MAFPDWENPPTTEVLKNDFEQARSYHDLQIGKIQHWRNVLNVEGNCKPKVLPNRSQVQPKMVKKQAVWRYSALSEPFLNTPDLFQVDPRTFEDREAADQNELLLNYQFDNKINKVDFINKLVHRVVDDGTAIVKVGWKTVTKTIVRRVPQFQFIPAQSAFLDQNELMQYAQQMQQLAQLQLSNPRGFRQKTAQELQAALEVFQQTQQLVVAQITGYKEVSEEINDENHPTVTVLRPENVYIDPTSDGIQEDLNYVIYTFKASKSYLQASGLYENLDQVDWNQGYEDTDYKPAPGDGMQVTTPGSEDSRRKVVVKEWWGFYDIHGTGELVPVVCSWVGDTIIRMAENPFPDQKLPFVFIAYLPVADSIYGEPDAELLEDHQRILGAVYRGVIDLLAKSANSQQGFAKGMLDVVNRKKFYAGMDYEFNIDAMPANGGYIMHTYPEIPASALNFLQLQNYEAESLTGIKAYAGGLSGESYGKTVSAANFAHDAAANIEMDILRRIAQGMSTIGSKIIAMNAVFLDDEEVIRITNKSNEYNKEFLALHPEDLRGNFDCRVDIKTAKSVEDTVTKLTMLMQTVGPNVDFGILKIAMSKLADLMKAPDMAEAIRNYEPQPDPLLEENKQLINDKLKAEIQEINTESTLNEAKTTSEQFKGMDSAASAQHKDMQARREALEYEEEAQGINHQRDLEKMRAQADSQEVQAIIKGMMTPVKEGAQKPNIDPALGLHLAKDRLKENAEKQFAMEDLVNQLNP